MTRIIPYLLRAPIVALLAGKAHRWRGDWHSEEVGGWIIRFERTARGWRYFDAEKRW